jgi:tRNA(Met) C34 N-acetyltransferase TmcA
MKIFLYFISLPFFAYFRYSNIYITSPAPDNLKILFEFILKGFNALDYQDHMDYDIQYSSNDHKEKMITQLTIHRPKQHRQVIQVIFTFLSCPVFIIFV